MSECTTCSYYGKHLEGRTEDMPWPCIECPGGEMYVERGKRKHQVPLRVQLSALEARHTALREAVAWERDCIRQLDYVGKFWEDDNAPGRELIMILDAARAEVDRLIANESAADCRVEG